MSPRNSVLQPHWKYKEGSSGKATYEDKITTLRQIIDWQKDLSDDKTAEHNQEYTRLFEDRVYVFTPQGDVYDLPIGATPLDFAYYIHTEWVIAVKALSSMANSNHSHKPSKQVIELKSKPEK